MKKILQITGYGLIGAALLLPRTVGIASADVCGEGLGIPPFLSSGARPNLLMVLDNSGSMLDAAYSDATSFCFDDTYISTKTYGGYFEQDRWYKWIGSGTDASYDTLPPWQSETDYTTGQRVYANGIIWEAKTTDKSSAADNIGDDIGVAWKKVTFTDVAKWFSGTSYTTGDIVWYGPQMYRATAASTNKAPDGADGGNFWTTVDSTWENGKEYSAGDIVSYKGSLYTAGGDGGTSSGTGVYDDTGVTWNLLKEGSFVAVDGDSAAAYCSGATDSRKYTHSDLCLSINETKNPDQVSAFAARGNFLNWAMASKFDVEKKILTGGRYDYKDDLLMTEHRGCSGSRMVKQIQMDDIDSDGDGTVDVGTGKYLSLGVRGSRHNDAPAYEDRVDSTDDTARLEILAITDSGYQMSQACKDAIDKIVAKDGDINGTQNQIDACISSFPGSDNELTDMRPALNHSLQACWQDDPATDVLEINKGKLKSLIGVC
ncbi:MAG: hypothetical protein D3906_01985, partial [Candidatus Electrothrix sp. AUS1_2]|nr:hypothetical protein [Candidatus Electrothrix sp. AUS1_2]